MNYLKKANTILAQEQWDDEGTTPDGEGYVMVVGARDHSDSPVEWGVTVNKEGNYQETMNQINQIL